MEYSVPREHAVAAVRAARAALERHAVSFPIELRFTAGDDALLSPAHGRDSAFVAVHVFQGMAYEPAFREVEAALSRARRPPALGQALVPGPRAAGAALPALGRLPAHPRASSTPAGASPTPGSATCWDERDEDVQHLRRRRSSTTPEDPDGYHAGMDRFGPKIGAAKIGALGLRAAARPGVVPVPLRVRRGVDARARGPAERPPPRGRRTCSGRATPRRSRSARRARTRSINAPTETVRLPDALDQGRARRTRSTRTRTRSGSGTATRASTCSCGSARTSTTTTAKRPRGRSCPRRGRSARCSTSSPPCDQVHDVEALAQLARLGVAEPDAVADLQRGGRLAHQRRLDLARALARVQPQARGQERPRQPVAPGGADAG